MFRSTRQHPGDRAPVATCARPFSPRKFLELDPPSSPTRGHHDGSPWRNEEGVADVGSSLKDEIIGRYRASNNRCNRRRFVFVPMARRQGTYASSLHSLLPPATWRARPSRPTRLSTVRRACSSPSPHFHVPDDRGDTRPRRPPSAPHSPPPTKACAPRRGRARAPRTPRSSEEDRTRAARVVVASPRLPRVREARSRRGDPRRGARRGRGRVLPRARSRAASPVRHQREGAGGARPWPCHQ